MGTDVVVLTERDARHGADGIAAVRTLFADWDATLSRFRADSELSRLNASGGRPFVAGRLLAEVLWQSLEAAAATGGLFDPTVHDRLVDLGYDRTFDALRADDVETVLRAWRPGRWRAIQLDRRTGTVRLPEGVALDFGGIAKGMAVDAATERLGDFGVESAAVAAGGDLAVRGLPSDGGAWDVGVELPAGTLDVSLPSGAFATSTTLRRRWLRGGAWRHHLIDPRTGLSAESDVVSASVAAATCREAEVAAKTALILGAEAGRRFLDGLGLDGLLAHADGTVIRVGSWGAREPSA